MAKSTQKKEYRTTYSKLSGGLKCIIADLAIDAFKTRKPLTDARFNGSKLLTINIYPTFIKKPNKLKGKNFKFGSVMVKEDGEGKEINVSMLVLDKKFASQKGIEEKEIVRT
jgi:hypothetical protein